MSRKILMKSNAKLLHRAASTLKNDVVACTVLATINFESTAVAISKIIQIFIIYAVLL